MDMVRGLSLLLFLAASCSPGRGGEDGGDPEGDGDAAHEDDDRRDEPEDVNGSDEVADGIEDAPDDSPAECYLPIRDCGPGCRQVTCVGVVSSSWTCDTSEGKLAYYSGLPAVPSGVGVYVKDLAADEEKLVVEYPDASHRCMYLAMHNGIIAYDNDTIGDSIADISLYLHDLDASLDTTLLSYTGTATEDIPTIKYIDIYKDIIVWDGKPEGEYLDGTDLFMFDIRSMERTKLTDNLRCHAPRIWGRDIVCNASWSDNGDDVGLFNLDAGELVDLTNLPASQDDVDIKEGRVVWADTRNGTCSDIYWCDLPECEPQPATTNWACQDDPSLGDNWIVWQDYRNDSLPLTRDAPGHDNIEVWGYNVTTGEEHQLASFGEITGQRLVVDNNKLYFLMNADPDGTIVETGAIFELDLSQFM